MRIERVVTSPPGDPDFQNNTWLVGDDEVIVIDPGHDAQAVFDALEARPVVAIALTHGHWDHITEAPRLAELTGAPIYLNEADRFLWEEQHPGIDFLPLEDGGSLDLSGGDLVVLFTAGHTPGSTTFIGDGVLFTGDTLFEGGPGATRWDYSDFDTIITSVTALMAMFRDDTVIHTGHGPSTTIGAEKPHLQEWIDRGW